MKTQQGHNLPDFICLGAQKGGTTTLHEMLKNHPSAYMPREKETHFFSNNYNKGTRWYETKFDGCREKQLCGEITPYYLYHPLAAIRMKKTVPNAKLIILLRDPVERAISQYFHSKRLMLENLEIEKAFSEEKTRLQDSEVIIKKMNINHLSHQEHSYLARSRYEEQLPIWENNFNKKQMLIIKSEDFFENTNEEWTKIINFLGLEKTELEREGKKENAGKGEEMEVRESFKKNLQKQLGKTYTWAKEKYGIEWKREYN